MRHFRFKPKYLVGGGFLAYLTVALIYGCASQQRVAPTTVPAASMQSNATPTKGRAQIWAENCARCHNMRGPDWYSDAEWEVAMQHMRVRGYLTGQEHKAIEEFLKAGN
ncbi:MAG: hypothetical protein ABIP49_03115 [Lysobacterales bacterium]